MKVLVIYDLDPAWEQHEIREARNSGRVLFQSLKKEGIETYLEELQDQFLERRLERYNPADTIVFNLCETMPGIPCGERKIVEIIENRGFTYTGNVPEVIEIRYYKIKVKAILFSLGSSVRYGQVFSTDEVEMWT